MFGFREKNTEQEPSVTDTKTFESAIDNGNFESAEEYLKSLKKEATEYLASGVDDIDTKKYDHINHRELYLFRAYRQKAQQTENVSEKITLWKKAITLSDESWLEDCKENRFSKLKSEMEKDFEMIINKGDLGAAEEYLELIKTGFSEDIRFIDHRERELFQAYYKIEDWVSAKRIVEDSVKGDSKISRMSRLEKLSKKKYGDI